MKKTPPSPSTRLRKNNISQELLQENVSLLSDMEEGEKQQSLSYDKNLLNPAHVSKAYDGRYSEGSYKNKFNQKQPIIPAEKKLFGDGVEASTIFSFNPKIQSWKEAQKKVAADRNLTMKPLVITALDFGCGDGRDLELWIDLADKLKNSGATLRVKSYDISEKGIEAYREKLTDKSDPKKPLFKKMGINSSDDNEERKNNERNILKNLYDENNARIFTVSAEIPTSQKNSGKENPSDKTSTRIAEAKITNYGVFRHYNLEIELLHGDPQVKPAHLKQIFGNEVDMTLVLYGSLSHIFPAKMRDDFLKELLNITQGAYISTIPGERYFQRQLTNKELGDYNSLDLGRGEIIYTPSESKKSPPLPFVVYDREHIEEILKKAADGKDFKLLVSSVYNPSEVSSSQLISYIDFILTAIANSNLYLGKSDPITGVGYWSASITPKSENVIQKNDPDKWTKKIEKQSEEKEATGKTPRGHN